MSYARSLGYSQPIGQLAPTWEGPGPSPNSPAATAPTQQKLGVGGAVVIVGVLGLVGFLVYQRVKVTKSIADKHGVGGALAFEGGMAAIDRLRRNE